MCLRRRCTKCPRTLCERCCTLCMHNDQAFTITMHKQTGPLLKGHHEKKYNVGYVQCKQSLTVSPLHKLEETGMELVDWNGIGTGTLVVWLECNKYYMHNCVPYSCFTTCGDTLQPSCTRAECSQLRIWVPDGQGHGSRSHTYWFLCYPPNPPPSHYECCSHNTNMCIHVPPPSGFLRKISWTTCHESGVPYTQSKLAICYCILHFGY